MSRVVVTDFTFPDLAQEEAAAVGGGADFASHQCRTAADVTAVVAGADVVVVNPTHYAVALKWNRAKRQAPVCVAKGVDEVAAACGTIGYELLTAVTPRVPRRVL